MPDLSHESELIRAGHRLVAGIDEAGRGPLAGPVAAAAVILPAGYLCVGLNDSKKLSAAKRDKIYDILTRDERISWAVATASSSEIDELNILNATHLAMRRAVLMLQPPPDHCLVDGLPVKNLPVAHTALVKGDSLSLSIAAASVIAKVTRDRIMQELDSEFPHYGFARHQGYGTRAHLEALNRHGPCRHHRRSFQPVAQLTLPLD